MPVNLSGPGPIDPDDPQFETMLRHLQGNILKGHGRDHSVNIFVQLAGDAPRARQRLGALAKRLVTSALRQRDEARQFRQFGIPGSLFGNVLLTARGYAALGMTASQVNGAFSDPFFQDGLEAHGGDLNDPDPATWDEGFRGRRIDALILLADADRDFLLRQARAVMDELQAFSTVLAVEIGDALRTEDGEGIEHFGYVDGRSQPIYFTTDLPNEGGTDQWNPVEPLERVLIPDPQTAEPDAFGSYFVFRKLEQDVLHFKMREQELADALGLEDEERERAGAMAVGRFEDGTPLAVSQTDGFIPKKENNFNYGIDPDGLRCPFQAHIRKANPRGDIERTFHIPQATAERPRRITRRGITYGKRNMHPQALQGLDDLPTKDVGLLFACFQASIENQFAFIQSTWVNNEGFVKAGTGLDPVIGQAAAGGAPNPQQWRAEWGVPGSAQKPFSFHGFVTLKGGECFFAPSIPFLESL